MDDALGKSRSTHLPGHVPELQRALAAAAVDIATVEERLSSLFERTEGKGSVANPKTLIASTPRVSLEHGPADGDLDEPIDLEAEEALVEDVDGMPIREEFAGPDDRDDGEDDRSFAELDAALAAEEPEHPEEHAEPVKPEKVTRGFLRRRTSQEPEQEPGAFR